MIPSHALLKRSHMSEMLSQAPKKKQQQLQSSNIILKSSHVNLGFGCVVFTAAKYICSVASSVLVHLAAKRAAQSEQSKVVGLGVARLAQVRLHVQRHGGGADERPPVGRPLSRAQLFE